MQNTRHRMDLDESAIAQSFASTTLNQIMDKVNNVTDELPTMADAMDAILTATPIFKKQYGKKKDSPPYSLDEISRQTQKLIQESDVVTRPRVQQPASGLRAFIQEIRRSRHQQALQKTASARKEQKIRPKLSFDTGPHHLTDTLLIQPPESKPCPYPKCKKRSLDMLNSRLDMTVRQQCEERRSRQTKQEQEVEKEERALSEGSSEEECFESDHEDSSLTAVAEQDGDNDDEDEDETQEENSNQEDDDQESEEELVAEKKKKRFVRIQLSDQEENQQEDREHQEDSLLDLLSGKFVTAPSVAFKMTMAKSKYVDIEAEEEDEMGGIISEFLDEQEGLNEEAKLVLEANAILAQEGEEIEENEEMVKALFQQQHAEQDEQETNAMLARLDSRRRERAEEKLLKMRRRRAKILMTPEPLKQLASTNEQIDQEEDYPHDSVHYLNEEKIAFRQWKAEQKERYTTNTYQHVKQTNMIMSMSSSAVGMKSVLLCKTQQQLSRLHSISLEPERKVATFKKVKE